MGSVSKTDITVSGKKLKNSDTVESITLSAARNPSLFLKKNTLLIFCPIKAGFGDDSEAYEASWRRTFEYAQSGAIDDLLENNA